MAIPEDINSDITTISDAKAAIRSAITAQGVSVSDSTTLAEYAQKIRNIDSADGFHPPLLSTIWLDHKIDDDNTAFVCPNDFAWHTELEYSHIYFKLLAEYTDESSTTVTEGSITYKRTPKEYKIVDTTQEAAVQALYESTGIAWYYIIDVENQRFKLPRTKWQFVGLRDGAGNYVAESLPNIKGAIAWHSWHSLSSGAFYTDGKVDNTRKAGTSTDSNAPAAGASFNASRSSSTYQDNAAVQQRATQMYLYFYLGNSTNTAEQIATAVSNIVVKDTQWINLELNNGTLTLKAGSVLCVPNGFEADGTTLKFNEVTVESDINYKFVGATLNNLLLVRDTTHSGCGVYVQGGNAVSGPTPPTIATGTVDYIWYDTTNNLMKISHDTQSTWQNIPLPIGVVNSSTDSGFTAINQTFQSIGYIGSTFFVRKGLKGLIANGRNVDGTLKSIKWNSEKIVETYTFASTVSGYCSPAYGHDIERLDNMFFNSNSWNYDTQNNYMKFQGIKKPWLPIANCKTTSGVISEFKPYKPVRLLNDNEEARITLWGIPDYSTRVDISLPYTTPSNGFVSGVMTAAHSENYYVRVNGYNVQRIYGETNQRVTGPFMFPVAKGDVISTTGGTNTVAFYKMRGV